MKRLEVLSGVVVCGLAAGCAAGAKQEPAAKVSVASAPAAVAAPAPAAPVAAKPVIVPLSSFKAVGDVYLVEEEPLIICSNGLVEASVKVPEDGEYRVTVTCSGDAAKNELPKFKLHVDGKGVGAETPLAAAEAKAYTFTAMLKAGVCKIGIEFTNDYYEENVEDRNLKLEGVELQRVK